MFVSISFSLVFSTCYAQCEDVTLASITNPGPYSVSILVEDVDEIRNGPDYDGATIYYPNNGVPPYAGIAIVQGYCGVETDIQDWGPFYASHGIVAITLGTNDPCVIGRQCVPSLYWMLLKLLSRRILVKDLL